MWFQHYLPIAAVIIGVANYGAPGRDFDKLKGSYTWPRAWCLADLPEYLLQNNRAADGRQLQIHSGHCVGHNGPAPTSKLGLLQLSMPRRLTSVTWNHLEALCIILLSVFIKPIIICYCCCYHTIVVVVVVVDVVVVIIIIVIWLYAVILCFGCFIVGVQTTISATRTRNLWRSVSR